MSIDAILFLLVMVVGIGPIVLLALTNNESKK